MTDHLTLAVDNFPGPAATAEEIAVLEFKRIGCLRTSHTKNRSRK